jgi:hypothetical protein
LTGSYYKPRLTLNSLSSCLSLPKAGDYRPQHVPPGPAEEFNISNKLPYNTEAAGIGTTFRQAKM